MKRVSVLVLAVGAVALAATGCGGSDESTDASGLRKGNTSASAPADPSTPASAPAEPAEDTESPESSPTSPVDTSSLGPASRTTCGEFKELDGDAEKALIERILAENPDSPFAGSPNVALGTAKLVCLAPDNEDKPVAVAARIV
ncbi:hypothetical protein IU433_06655 [Nocardia puris]|uniref:hypothetical protein n=1 Tax=Nocardia puris TaxID=208602 RepID=UPI001894E310|nr:hypothetical protein [Nocardia puris]MBF6211215.1 hypothetical protein [Nocardia puris]MBF6364934.1 hypothetical protein [Nocardia puris]MBF6458720.1 hypothetical protein [Nocardia puris]